MEFLSSDEIITEESYYIFPIDTESMLFFDIVLWSIQRCSNHTCEESIDLINCFYKLYPNLWDDYWYEHEGFSQLISAIFYEESGQGKYGDLNFPMFREQFICQYSEVISSLGFRHSRIISNLEYYSINKSIQYRINCIDKCLDPFWAIF